MPQYTSNMDLYKVDLETDGNSTFNIKTMLNDNWDKIDSKYDEQEGRIRGNSEVVNEVKEDVGDKGELKTEDKSSLVGAVNEVSAGMADIAKVIVATGTGIAVTLSMPSVTAYARNMKLTFIASGDNNGSATTIDINGLGVKSLYKPNTVIAPNIKSGKPYTVWYDGANFFLQASAEGNALAEHVLAGKMFSNDDDVSLVGTMNLSNLVPSNVKKGVDINGIIGTFESTPFPLAPYGENTGGFVQGYQLNGISATISTSEGMIVSYNKDRQYCQNGMVTDTRFDVTDYRTLIIKWKASASDGQSANERMKFYIGGEKMGDQYDNGVFVVGREPQLNDTFYTEERDITAITGEHYLRFNVMNGNGARTGQSRIVVAFILFLK